MIGKSSSHVLVMKKIPGGFTARRPGVDAGLAGWLAGSAWLFGWLAGCLPGWLAGSGRLRNSDG